MKENFIKILRENCEHKAQTIFYHFIYITNTGEILDFLIYNNEPNIVHLMHESVTLQKFDSEKDLKTFFSALNKKKTLSKNIFQTILNFFK